MTGKPALPPAPVQRTPFDRWLWERDISNVAAGERLGRHEVTVARWRLPFSSEKRRIPDAAVIRDIEEWTQGEVGPADFYPPSNQNAVRAFTEGAA